MKNREKKYILYKKHSKILCRFLKEEITKVIDEELIKNIKNPNYHPNLIPFK